jgi:acyl dehydratase
MPLNPDAVGAKSQPGEKRWDSKDAILYALGVGCGVDDLPFDTENTKGVQQQVLPTMGVVLGVAGGGAYDAVGEINWTMLVHGEQAIELHRPIPVEGNVRSVTTVTGIYDKGSGAVLATETESVDAGTGEPLFTTRSAAFIRGAGGWGGDRGPTGPRPTAPEREPDHVVKYQTGIDQALIYRLSGDRNPLHSDPSFAEAAGFDRPILHGLCTYGFTGRALLSALCDNDPARFKSMEARFTSPVFPGDELTISIWRTDDGEAVFQTRRPGDVVVVDNGLCRFA